MIIGNGMIATALSSIDNDQTLFFASGVSNSLETSPKAFQREENLLNESLKICQNRPIEFYYFSTSGVEDLNITSRKYFHHKKRMEEIICANSSVVHKKIFRLPNMVGISTNPNTLTNFIHSCWKSGKWQNLEMNAQRELLDVELLPRLVWEHQNIPDEIIRLKGIQCTVSEILSAFKKNTGAPPPVKILLNKYYR